jgi:ribosomal silencing factor RsfS
MIYNPEFFVAVGLIIFFISQYFIMPRINRTVIAKTGKSRASVMFYCNLILIMAGLDIALFALKITAEGSKMSPSDLQTLTNWVSAYTDLLWVLAGILLGTLLKFLSQSNEISKNEVNTQMTNNDNNLISKIEKENGKIEIKIDFKIDTADLSKMNTEQLKSVADYLALIQQKNIDEKLNNIANQIKDNNDKDINRAERDRYESNGWVAISFGLTALVFSVSLLPDNTNNKNIVEIIALVIVGIGLACTGYWALAKARSFEHKI